jgi:hypothetical protein
MLCQLEAQLESGDSVTLISDDTWESHGTGTWLNDLQSGERTDLRNELGDTGWDPVSLRAAPGSQLVAARDDGIQVVDVLPCPRCLCGSLVMGATSWILAPMRPESSACAPRARQASTS